jgi:hypothetical protein
VCRALARSLDQLGSVSRLLPSWTSLTTCTCAASFSLLVYSASVALQALTVISIGNLADDRAFHSLPDSLPTRD